MRYAARLFCRWFGHRWRGHEIRYEQGTTLAYIGNTTEKTEVDVTWVNDESCARCGCKSWWPA